MSARQQSIGPIRKSHLGIPVTDRPFTVPAIFTGLGQGQTLGSTRGACQGCSSQRLVRIAVLSVLIVHGALLAYSATQCSPTFYEPAHLAAGIDHWTSGRFNLYRVNPPLIKMIAALPVLSAGFQQEDSSLQLHDRVGPEFSAGRSLIKLNRERCMSLFVIARFACIPLCMIGGLVCYLWATDLFGPKAGLLACSFWCFCPNILAHGSLITPDAHSAALGVGAAYAFWRWLKRPVLSRAFASGTMLGIALLSKLTLILLPAIWVPLWLIHHFANPHATSVTIFAASFRRELALLLVTFVTAVNVINLGYGLQPPISQVSETRFKSALFRDVFDVPSTATTERGGPRLYEPAWTRIALLAIPRDYVLGIDDQLHELESPDHIPSYVHGEFGERGWWYFYLYAVAVKVPAAVLLLAVLAISGLAWRYPAFSESNAARDARVAAIDGLIVVSPLLVIFAVTSYHSAFTKHMRYILPCFPFAFIWISRIATDSAHSATGVLGRRPRQSLGTTTNGAFGHFLLRYPVRRCCVCFVIMWAVVSGMATFPNSLSYFNEFAGGAHSGAWHLIGSNADWGQDLIRLRRWQQMHGDRSPLFVALYGNLDPRDLGVKCQPVVIPAQDREDGLAPGWYVISESLLRGMPWFSIPFDDGTVIAYPMHAMAIFRRIESVGRIGGSLVVFRVRPHTRSACRMAVGGWARTALVGQAGCWYRDAKQAGAVRERECSSAAGCSLVSARRLSDAPNA
jgi:hypothetical protein